MDIILIDDNYIEEMVRIWNANKKNLSETESEKDVTAESLMEWRDNEPVKFYGVIVDEDIHDELGGFFVLSERGDHIVLEHMAIDDRHRRKGVGDAILRYCKYEAKERFDDNLKLTIYPHNIGGVNFFFATGFIIESFDRDNHMYTMVLED
jgi:GNAT superfamily N-acetyltransferase